MVLKATVKAGALGLGVPPLQLYAGWQNQTPISFQHISGRAQLASNCFLGQDKVRALNVRRQRTHGTDVDNTLSQVETVLRR